MGRRGNNLNSYYMDLPHEWINRAKNNFLFCVLAILLLGCSVDKQSGLAKLETHQEVESLINSMLKNQQTSIWIEEEEIVLSHIASGRNILFSDSLSGLKTFFKGDFDNNGLTDIIALWNRGEMINYVVMDFGSDSLKIYNLNSDFGYDLKFNSILHDSILVFDSFSNSFADSSSKKVYKLIHKFNSFIEYNPYPTPISIEKIEFETTLCFGSCPKFKIEITSNREGLFHAMDHNRKTRNSELIEGIFKTQIDTNSYKEIVNLIKYLNIEKLKNEYDMLVTDLPSLNLKITYDGGKEKFIYDYGIRGTLGLRKLYQLFYELRFNQNW